jgi:serine/threonine-protein kinase
LSDPITRLNAALEGRELVSSGSNPRYVPTGHLIYGHGDQALMGVPFDLETLQTTGRPRTLLPDMAVSVNGGAVFGVSENGTLIYASSVADISGETDVGFVWVDLEGNETPLPLRTALPRIPRLSPDGGRIAYESDEHLWVYDLASGSPTQLTFVGRNISPIWSPDGLLVCFLSERSGTEGLDGFRQAANGATEAQQLWKSARGEAALTSISPDGTWLVVGESTPGRGLNVALVALGPDSVSFREYLSDSYDEYEGTISPDGRWMAYTSNEFGSQEVFVRDFPQPMGQWRLSDGGYDPVWAPDGRALYYGGGTSLMKVDVTTEGTFSHGQPTPLFEWQYDAAGLNNTGYAIHPDGDRFVALGGAGVPVGDIYIVTNWFEERKQLMGN